MVRLFWFARMEIFQNKRSVLKVVQNFQMEYLNGKCAYHLPVETSSRPYANFYLRHMECVNMAAAESSVFQCARTLKVHMNVVPRSTGKTNSGTEN